MATATNTFSELNFTISGTTTTRKQVSVSLPALPVDAVVESIVFTCSVDLQMSKGSGVVSVEGKQATYSQDVSIDLNNNINTTRILTIEAYGSNKNATGTAIVRNQMVTVAYKVDVLPTNIACDGIYSGTEKIESPYVGQTYTIKYRLIPSDANSDVTISCSTATIQGTSITFNSLGEHNITLTCVANKNITTTYSITAIEKEKTNNLYLGNIKIKSLYLGTKEIVSVYLGNTLIYSIK